MTKISTSQWDQVIKPKRSLFDIRFGELWNYRDLLFMFIKRDIVTLYKQTILGPIWFFIQPVLTMLVYIVVFSNIAKIPTDEIPPPVFYLAGIVMWNYFAECFGQTSDTFFQNASIFGKVYFPRLILPISKIISALIKYFIQLLLFLAVTLYFFIEGANIKPNGAILLIPFLVILMAGLGLGSGIIFSSLTTKYRDLKFLISFGVQLLMYATPVIYPMSIIPAEYRSLIMWNPIAHIIEAFKYAFLGTGELSSGGLLYASVFTLIILVAGVVIFVKTEENFADTI